MSGLGSMAMLSVYLRAVAGSLEVLGRRDVCGLKRTSFDLSRGQSAWLFSVAGGVRLQVQRDGDSIDRAVSKAVTALWLRRG